MCIAIYKPAGKWASKEALRNSYELNPHGAGYAYHDGQKVRIVKGFFSWRSFWKSYRRHVSSDTPALVHFRIATAGRKDAANCHPFDLGNGALMHNGPCLNRQYCKGDADRSDTMEFAEDFISGLESWQVARILPMIEEFIGTEKVVLMFDDGEVLLANEKNGHWANGCWWSNLSYKRFGYVGTSASKSYVTDEYSNYEWWNDYKREQDATSESGKVTTINKDDGNDDGEEIDNKPTLPTVISKPRARVVYSKSFSMWVPKYVYDNNEQVPFEWCEGFHSYVPLTMSDEAMADDEYIYDGVISSEMVIIADVIDSAASLRRYLAWNVALSEQEVLECLEDEGIINDATKPQAELALIQRDADLSGTAGEGIAPATAEVIH